MATPPVVIGVDGSEESLRAVEWAAREAVRHGAALRIVSAPAMPPRMWASDPAADLVVIGRHGGHDTGPAIGAVQHAVLNHAHGPVAVVPVKS